MRTLARTDSDLIYKSVGAGLVPKRRVRIAVLAFDTLDTARRLKGAGFNDAQAEAVTEILRDARSADLANLATKADIERLENKIEILRRDMTIRLGGMLVVATGILLAAKFFG